MMFLQYAIWGAWLPLLFPFLLNYRHFTPEQIGTMFAVGAMGSIVGPFVAGQIADRWFNTEKFLGISHLVGAVLVFQLAHIETYWGFLAFSLAYSLIYSPTLSLTNSISLHHLPDRDRDFGKVRLWGTVGWIAVGISIGQWLLLKHTPAGVPADEVAKAQVAGMADAFRASAVLGLLLGVYCFTLPRTAPSPGRKASATFEAIAQVKRQPLITLFLLAVPISCIHQFYFVHTSGFVGQYQNSASAKGFVDRVNSIFGVGGGGLMTIGQMSEIVVLALIPLVAKSVSRKTLLAIGIAAYAGRMALFAFVKPISDALGVDPVAVLIPGIALHGLCFGCFIFVSFLIIDENTSADVRASAQSLFGLVVFGIGIIVGSMVAGSVATAATDQTTKAMDYRMLFSYPMWGALACLLILLSAYPNRKIQLEPD
jgi:nucleoside transporter